MTPLVFAQLLGGLALVEVADPDAAGARVVGPVAGGIAVVDLPARRSSVLRPHLDLSLPAATIPAMREALGSSGEGTIIGVVDTGVDPTHADLVSPEGRARVAWIADLSEAPRGVHAELEALVDAAVYGPDEIQAAVDAGDPSLVGGADRIGHGTHVASIAAGRWGVAPDASLVIVKASRAVEGTFADADVVLATRFVFALATQLARPAVVNLSLGGHDGAHDGASLLERGLVASLEEQPAGRAIVAAAGNDAYRDAHATAVLSPDAPSAAVTLVVPRRSSEASHLRVAAYGTGALAVTVTPPPEAPDGRARVEPRADGGLDVTLDSPAPGRWSIHLHGSGRADLWIADTDIVGPLGTSPRFADHVDPGGQVTLPATADQILAVGSMATRTEWSDVDAELHHTPTDRDGDLSVFSARGPTRDGRPKPDLVAPGEAIVAALSSETDPHDARSAFHHPGALDGALVDEAHAVLWGTSAAAAHVSGVAAVLFAADPTLDARRLSALLCGTATPRADRAWSVAHGWGALDAARAADVLVADPLAAVDPDASLAAAVPDVAAPGDTVRVLVSLRSADGAPASGEPSLEVRVAGEPTPLPLRLLGGGRAEATWVVPARALWRDVAFEVIAGDELLPAVPVTSVAWRRADLGAAERVAGGGCAAMPHTGVSVRSPVLATIAAWLAACWIRRRRPGSAAN